MYVPRFPRWLIPIERLCVPHNRSRLDKHAGLLGHFPTQRSLFAFSLLDTTARQNQLSRLRQLHGENASAAVEDQAIDSSYEAAGSRVAPDDVHL